MKQKRPTKNAFLINTATRNTLQATIYDDKPTKVLERLTKSANLNAMQFIELGLDGTTGDWVFVCKGFKPNALRKDYYDNRVEEALKILD